MHHTWNRRLVCGVFPVLGIVGGLAVSFATLTAKANPPGIPQGLHKVWQFNLIGHPGDYNGNCGNGHRMFVDRDAHHAHIIIEDDNDGWHIEDCNATGNNKGRLHTDQVGIYAIYVRILGQPGGELDICADTLDDHTGTCSNGNDPCVTDADCNGGGVCELGENAHTCLLGIIDLTRGNGRSNFSLAPSSMFDAELEDIIWNVDTHNFRLAQFRVYEIEQ